MSSPPLSVGSRVDVWLGGAGEQDSAALFYQWRRVTVVDLDRSRVRVRYSQPTEHEEEWIDLASNRLRLPGAAGAQPGPTTPPTQPPAQPSAPLAPTPPPPSGPTPTLREPYVVSSDHPPVDAVSSMADDSGLSDADVVRFFDSVDHPSAASSSTASSSSSPTSTEAARAIAAQGVDASFFAAAPAPSAASASAPTRPRPPPLPSNIPPPRPAVSKAGSLSPPITSSAVQHAPSRSFSHPVTSSLDPWHSIAAAAMADAAALTPAPPPAAHSTAVAAAPHRGSLDPHSALAPHSFEQFTGELQGRPDPDRYQIYLQQWHAQHPSSDASSSTQPSSIPNGRPPLTSLPVSTQQSLPSHLPSRKLSTDLSSTGAPEVLSEFARDLTKSSLVDVWRPKTRQWLLGEVVDESQSAEKGSMINVIDHQSQAREWMRRASRRLAEPFTNSANPQATSPPPSPVRTALAPVKKATSDAGVQQKVTAALSSLSSAASAAASSAAAALLPSSVTAPRSGSSGSNGLSHQPSSSSASQHRPLAHVQTPAWTVVAMPHPAPTTQNLPVSTAPSSSASSAPAMPAATALSTAPPPGMQVVHPSEPPASHAPPPPSVVDPPLCFGHTLVMGSQLDVLDTEQKWRLAEVQAANNLQVFVHYLGWGAKWDEWIDRDSGRLLPPRTYTVGDTGSRTAAPPLQPIAHAVTSPFGSSSSPSYSSYSPYVPPPPSYTLPAKPSSRYDCRGECKWRRVLSMGLGHREMHSLDLLFARCCQLQDDYQERVLVQEEQNPQLLKAFREALQTVSGDIERVKQALPSFASFYTQQCSNIVRTIDSGISDMEEQVKRQMLAMQEAAYMQRLRRHFQLIEVPPDGSCLFAAVGQGMAHRAEQMHQEEEHSAHTPLTPPSLPTQTPPPTSPHLAPHPPSAAAEAPQDAAMQEAPPAPPTAKEEPSPSSSTAVPMEDAAPQPSPAAPPTVPSSSPPPPASPSPSVGAMSPRHVPYLYRKQAVHHLLANASFHTAIRHEVREALVQEREGHGDATSALIQHELQRRFGQSPEQLERVLEGDDALQVYASVMEKEGIYGTQLEVEALSSALHVPIHVYYRAGTEHDGAAPDQGLPLKPTQIIGEHEKGPPVDLAYYMANRHYNLLVPKPPPPPPPPVSLPVPAAVPSAPSTIVGSDLSLSLQSQLPAADDELMVALLENGTPSPLPPAMLPRSVEPGAVSVVDEGLSLKRARSSGHLGMDKSPGSEDSGGSGSELRIRKRGESKDELHLLMTTAPSAPSVRQLVSRWDAGAPAALLAAAPEQPPAPSDELLHVPPPTAPAGEKTSPPSSRSSSRRSSIASRDRSVSPSRPAAPAVHLLVHAQLSSTPTSVSAPLHRPLRLLLYGLPSSSSAVLIRQSDQTQLNLDLTPLDYHLADGEHVTVVDEGAKPHLAHDADGTQTPTMLPVAMDASRALAATAEAEALHGSVAEKDVADAVHAMVEQVVHDGGTHKLEDHAMAE